MLKLTSHVPSSWDLLSCIQVRAVWMYLRRPQHNQSLLHSNGLHHPPSLPGVIFRMHRINGSFPWDSTQQRHVTTNGIYRRFRTITREPCRFPKDTGKTNKKAGKLLNARESCESIILHAVVATAAPTSCQQQHYSTQRNQLYGSRRRNAASEHIQTKTNLQWMVACNWLFNLRIQLNIMQYNISKPSVAKIRQKRACDVSHPRQRTSFHEPRQWIGLLQ